MAIIIISHTLKPLLCRYKIIAVAMLGLEEMYLADKHLVVCFHTLVVEDNPVVDLDNLQDLVGTDMHLKLKIYTITTRSDKLLDYV